MEWQTSLFYIIPTIFMLLLIFPIVFQLRFTVLPLENNCVVALYFFKIKLFYFVVSFHGTMVRIENDKKLKYKEIEFSRAQFDTMQHFLSKVSKKIKLKEMEIMYNVGTGDAFSSAMLCGELNQILIQSFLWIRKIKPTTTIKLFDNVSYNRRVCVFVLNNKISFTPLDILSTFVYAFVTRTQKI